MFNVKRTSKGSVSYAKKAPQTKSHFPRSLTPVFLQNLISPHIEEKYQCLNTIFDRQNETEYQVLIGFLYQNGLGVLKNGMNAAYWYACAAKDFNSEAKQFLSDLEETPKNGSSATSFLLYADVKAFYGEFEEACRIYKVIYANNIYTYKSSIQFEAGGRLGSIQIRNPNSDVAKEGYLLLLEAANSGDLFSMVELGHFFKARHNFTQALKWYSRACGLETLSEDDHKNNHPSILIKNLSLGIHPDAAVFAGEICETYGTLPKLQQSLKYYEIAKLLFFNDIEESIERVQAKIAKLTKDENPSTAQTSPNKTSLRSPTHSSSGSSNFGYSASSNSKSYSISKTHRPGARKVKKKHSSTVRPVLSKSYAQDKQ